MRWFATGATHASPLQLRLPNCSLMRPTRRPRALHLEEVRLTHEPDEAVPQLAGCFALRHRVDDRAEHARSLTVLQDDGRYAERLRLLHDGGVLRLHFVARGGVGQR